MEEITLLLLLWLKSLCPASSFIEIDCGNSSSVCPNASVELYCCTTVPVLIWNVLEVELDFTVKDAIGTIESFDGFTAELISRDGGTQSKLTFTMNALIEAYVINCHDALGSSVATCQINQPELPKPPVNFTCQLDSYSNTTILMWEFLQDMMFIKSFEVISIPNESNINCSIMNYSKVTATMLTIYKNASQLCEYSTYAVRAVNCMGDGQLQNVTCTVIQAEDQTAMLVRYVSNVVKLTNSIFTVIKEATINDIVLIQIIVILNAATPEPTPDAYCGDKEDISIDQNSIILQVSPTSNKQPTVENEYICLIIAGSSIGFMLIIFSAGLFVSLVILIKSFKKKQISELIMK